ncbi:hypothetical protein AJ80_09133 [Polytolypa hystricis UAMH7299]|uniref:Uncharacterized protein n=1 Tax=Polytolypa hystricis (strain UAMH7299) TaxID=1447883 RepID=A0A2B7WW55_POLH7|nr:hypothetical protein AJ80_09133 [Polytolypa hystricis UAMH7299]
MGSNTKTHPPCASSLESRAFSSGISDTSDRPSTAPTIYSQSPIVQHLKNGYFEYVVDPRESTATYTSTVPSIDDLDKEPQVEVVDDRYEDFPAEAIPSTPPSFAELFPSTRRLLISHDDTTIDGNMNLRVDTMASEPLGRQNQIILFHLRMYDLHERKFSLRRYCRDSGREVCHSTRKYYHSTSEKTPGRQRPLSSALSALYSKSDPSGPTTTNSLRRQDSGYRSGTEATSSTDSLSSVKTSVPTKTILLEFSNYAHVDVKRKGTKGSKHYGFEYFGTKYQWRRSVRKEGARKEVSYHLYHPAKSKPVAHIFPEQLTPLEALEEESKGGWVPPCSMWISDPSLFNTMSDVADMVVATGLIALVDDCIKRRWHRKEASSLSTPISSTFLKGVDSVTPTRIIEKVFHRRGSTGSRHTSLRQLFSHS